MKKPKPTGRALRSATDVDRCVGENVRRLRHDQGLTLAQLSHELGLSHQQLQKYETGSNRLSAGILMDLSRILQVSLTELFDMGDIRSGRSGSPAEKARRRCEAIIGQTDSPAKLVLMAQLLKVIRDSPAD